MSRVGRPSGSGGENIVWTDDELNKLYNPVFSAHMRRPDESLLMHIRNAQEQLPEDRRRNILSYASATKFLRFFKERTLQQYECWMDQEREIQSLTDRLRDAKGETANLVAVDKMGLAAYSSVQLVDELAKRLHETNKVKIQQEPKPVERKRLVLCIFGPLSPQQETINQAVDDLETEYEVVLKFCDGGSAIPTGCDYYIIWTKFGNNASEARMQTYAKSGCFLRATTMLQLLELVETTIKTH